MAESYKGEELYPIQSSATSQGGETSSGTEDISRYYKKLVQQAKRKSKRRSARLVEKAAKGSTPKEVIVAHTHRYHTRIQPLSRSQLEETGRRRKPKAWGKVRKPTLTRRKNSAPPNRKVQELRVAKREKKADEITSLLESLECNSPPDELPLDSASHVLGDDAASAKKGRFSRDRLN
ncbi:hypothetical protein FOZ63_026889 [Perkinsus olseni]|uniref:Uncharacterized protein n=1 Tax=Perkinsus olseni TaxID=32597 RepID=A0A7J6RZY9_PEROL|nr:hypothetical protein FOZ62_009905 [Perkinsus olseni]KAF4726021.1 hypothetical protein FOZ63_026889 [Perkinsus olseni]